MVREGLHRSAIEDLSDHRAPLHDRSVLRSQAIQSRGEEGRDRRWDRHRFGIGGKRPSAALGVVAQRPLVDQHGEHLLDEQRVPLGGGDDLRAGVLRQARDSQEVGGDQRRFSFGERTNIHPDERRAPVTPPGSFVEQVLPGRAQQEHGCIPR